MKDCVGFRVGCRMGQIWILWRCKAILRPRPPLVQKCLESCDAGTTGQVRRWRSCS
jgi:hypothetical protein